MLKSVNENNKYESAAIKCMKSRHSCQSLSIGSQRLSNDHKIGEGSTHINQNIQQILHEYL